MGWANGSATASGRVLGVGVSGYRGRRSARRAPLALAAALLVALCGALATAAPAAAAPSGTQVMWRLYNPNTGEHFYTANTNECDVLSKAGWSEEGVAWLAPTSSTTPVYRLYNPVVTGGDHHYTMDSNERDMLVSKGWRYEGVGWYSDDAHGVALQRLYNPHAATGTHHYTVDTNERDSLVRAGWRSEGVAWYGVNASVPFGDCPSVTIPLASYIDQNASKAYWGCEAASLLMALQAKGYAQGVSYTAFLAEMPRTADRDPHHGFVGSPYTMTYGAYQGIFPSALTPWAKKYAPATDLSGCSAFGVLRALSTGKPVVAWVTVDFAAPRWKAYAWGNAVENGHVVTVIGFNEQNHALYVADPNSRGCYWVSWSSFTRAYDGMRFAVAIG